MAGVRFNAVKVAEELVASTTETIVQVVAATNHPLTILGWSISFAGGEPGDDMIRCELLRQTTAGTSSALTVVKVDETNGTTVDATALHDFTAEPTPGDILDPQNVHTLGGFYIYVPWPGIATVGAGNRAGVRVITPATNPAVTATIYCEE